MSDPSSPAPIAVIGAGLAGLSCAEILAAGGRSVTVFEKSRGTGGRLATRRGEAGGRAFALDHGAQFVSARSEAFAARLAGLTGAGAAAQWTPRGKPPEGRGWHVGAPGMSALVKPMAEGLEVRKGVRVERLDRTQAGWALTGDDGEALGEFGQVLITAPAPQAEALLGDEAALFPALKQVEIAPCWAAMAVFDAPLALDWDARRFETGALSWIARNTSKPGRGGGPEAWVLHASPQWSRENLERETEAVAPELLAAFAAQAGIALPDPIHLSAHRWRYALVETPAGEDCLYDAASGLGLAGDWCIGGRAEAAFLSGRALAQRVMETMS